MHLQLYARGIINQVRLWESVMQNHYFKWRRINLKTNKEEVVLVQGGLRPSVLGTYEYIFPEEALPDVLNILQITDRQNLGKGIDPNKLNLMHKSRLAVLRKICGVKKIPESAFKKARELPKSIYFKDQERGLSHSWIPGVAVHLIGFKKDRRGKMYDPVEKQEFDQEML